MSDHDNGTTRRSFLSAATVGVGAAIGGAIALPAAGYALASAGQETTFTPVDLGPIERFTSESGFAPTVADYVEDPAQPLVSSGLAYVHHTGHSNHDWLAPDAMFVVFSNRCTHVGCPAQATESASRAPATRASSTSRAPGSPARPYVRSTGSSGRSGPGGTCG